MVFTIGFVNQRTAVGIENLILLPSHFECRQPGNSPFGAMALTKKARHLMAIFFQAVLLEADPTSAYES
jgi:hypothetical protein